MRTPTNAAFFGMIWLGLTFVGLFILVATTPHDWSGNMPMLALGCLFGAWVLSGIGALCCQDS